MIKKVKQKIKNGLSFIQSSRVIFILFWEVILGIILTVGSIILFLQINGEVLEKDFLPVDLSILRFFYHLRTPLLNNLMIGISYLGGEMIVVLGILATIFLIFRKHKRIAILFMLVLAMSTIIDSILKNIVQRPRPQFYPLVIEKDFSFPSGHAMDSFVFYLMLSYLFFHLTKNKKLSMIVTILALFIIFLIGISRIYLGVHYPTDVLAGYVGGLFWFTSVLVIDKTLIFYKIFKKTR